MVSGTIYKKELVCPVWHRVLAGVAAESAVESSAVGSPDVESYEVHVGTKGQMEQEIEAENDAETEAGSRPQCGDHAQQRLFQSR